VAQWSIEPLSARHDRKSFSCGKDPLDRYIKEQAGQDIRRYLASAFVAVDDPSDVAIAGYFTMSAFGINPGDLPAAVAKRLPKYSLLPAVLIGRLAVDQRWQGRNLGRVLLIDALRKAYDRLDTIASAFVVVDALDEDAAGFYRKFGFLDFPEPIGRLFLPMQSVAGLL
jgi:GNAT superfamily N-acetyltransferase